MMAEDVAGLMDALDIPSARIAGISMGSGIAQELALGHPGKVRSLVLVSSWARCNLYAQTVFNHFHRVRASVSPSTFAQLLQLWIFTAPYYEKNMAALLEAQAAAAENPAMPQHAFRSAVRRLHRPRHARTAGSHHRSQSADGWGGGYFLPHCASARRFTRACPGRKWRCSMGADTLTIGKTSRSSTRLRSGSCKPINSSRTATPRPDPGPRAQGRLHPGT